MSPIVSPIKVDLKIKNTYIRQSFKFLFIALSAILINNYRVLVIKNFFETVGCVPLQLYYRISTRY